MRSKDESDSMIVMRRKGKVTCGAHYLHRQTWRWVLYLPLKGYSESL